jgi:glycosyltransferase involved in cell wall biosynthesis
MSAGRERKLLFFSPGQNEAGGCATHARLLSEALAARGWRVWVIARAAGGKFPAVRRAGSLTVVEVPGFGIRIGAGIYVAFGLLAGIALGRGAYVLSMQLGSQTLVGGLCARFWRRPFVAMSTTSGELSEVAEALASPRRALHRESLRRASRLVGQTPAAARELEAFVPASRTAVVPNPMPAGGLAALSGNPCAVYAGRFSAEKDLGLLLDAWREVVERIPRARLTLVGSGGAYRSVEAELHAAIAGEPALWGSVAFTGWVEDVGMQLRAADVFVFPSRSEGMSNSLLDACAWRRIVVASDIGANRAVLGDDYPLLFQVGEREALVAALLRAFGEETDRRAAVEQVERRCQALSSSSVAASLEEVLLAPRRAPD